MWSGVLRAAFLAEEDGAMAFGNCPALKDVKLNNGIKELGPMCLWATGVSDLKLPKGVHVKPEQLRLGQQNPDVLRIPASLKKVGDGCFQETTVKKVIVSSAVKELGDNTFKSCSELSEVVFEPNSHLEKIGRFCFYMCKLEKIVIPKKVKSIEAYAFSTCSELSSLTFETGRRLKHIGSHALEETQLTRANVRYPMTLKDKGTSTSGELVRSVALGCYWHSCLGERYRSEYYNSALPCCVLNDSGSPEDS